MEAVKMRNNDTLKRIAIQAGLNDLAEQAVLNYGEYMKLVCTDAWQAAFAKTQNSPK